MASIRSALVPALAALIVISLVSFSLADSRGSWGVPPPGFAYGGLPYGSVSGQVANFYAGSPRGAVLPTYGARSYSGNGNYLR